MSFKDFKEFQGNLRDFKGYKGFKGIFKDSILCSNDLKWYF